MMSAIYVVGSINLYTTVVVMGISQFHSIPIIYSPSYTRMSLCGTSEYGNHLNSSSIPSKRKQKQRGN